MSSQNKYKACIFDLDGTLTDTLEDLKNAANFAMRSMGFPERTKDEVRRFVGNGAVKLIERCVPEGTDKETQAKALAVYNGHYSVHLNDNTKPYDGIPELLLKLKEMNIRTAVVSNKDDGPVREIVRGFFGETIDFSVGRKDGVPPKPSPEGVLKALAALECRADEAIYIGDSDIDVLTARNAGLKCIGVTWGFRDRELLIESGADFIADSADEILRIIK